MRVWERGAGMTAACGSGACATLVAASSLNKSDKENKVALDGGDLFIKKHLYLQLLLHLLSQLHLMFIPT
ncbi:MAG: hypothetical protein VW078_08275, partial [Flavobacteriales bacterium]